MSDDTVSKKQKNLINYTRTEIMPHKSGWQECKYIGDQLVKITTADVNGRELCLEFNIYMSPSDTKASMVTKAIADSWTENGKAATGIVEISSEKGIISDRFNRLEDGSLIANIKTENRVNQIDIESGNLLRQFIKTTRELSENSPETVITEDEDRLGDVLKYYQQPITH